MTDHGRRPPSPVPAEWCADDDSPGTPPPGAPVLGRCIAIIEAGRLVYADPSAVSHRKRSGQQERDRDRW